MTVVEKHIQHFNRLNGNHVRKRTLVSFLNKVKAAALPELKPLEDRLAKGIAQMNGHVVNLVVDEPLKVPAGKKVKRKTFKPKSRGGLRGFDARKIIEFLDGYLLLEKDREKFVARLELIQDQQQSHVLSVKEFNKAKKPLVEKTNDIDSALDLQAEQGAKYIKESVRNFIDLVTIYSENKSDFKKKLYSKGLESFRIKSIDGVKKIKRKKFVPKARGKKKIVKKVKRKKFVPKARGKKISSKKKVVIKKKTKVVETPKPVRANKKLLPPVERKASSQAAKEQPKEHVVKKSANALAGFTTADQAPAKAQDTFRLPGVMGDLLGDLQRYKLEIVLAGETHSGKSEVGKQIADAFISHGDEVAWIDWEQGGLDSRDTTDSIARNLKPENKKKLHVSATVPKTLEAVKSLAKSFKVVVLDSGSSLKQVTNAWIDELREQHPETVWIILMQQNEKGGTRGGAAAEFDSPVVLKTYRPDESDYKKNYAYVFKNRGNKTGMYYLIADKKIVSKEPV
jgi:hypothetical protein